MARETGKVREQIYTIPVNDAFRGGAPCPLCELAEKATSDLVSYYLGPSLMEADSRVQTNETGFCREHLTRLYNSQENRLGLGLMLHTHLQKQSHRSNKLVEDAVPQAGGFMGGRKAWQDKLTAAADALDDQTERCVVCERLDYTMDRYLDVICWQFVNDDAFKQAFDASQGFCLPHVADLLRAAAKYLNREEAAHMTESLAAKMDRDLTELAGDVEWFTLKFDYRYQKEPWKNSKDALPRAIRRLVGDTTLE